MIFASGVCTEKAFPSQASCSGSCCCAALICPFLFFSSSSVFVCLARLLHQMPDIIIILFSEKYANDGTILCSSRESSVHAAAGSQTVREQVHTLDVMHK